MKTASFLNADQRIFLIKYAYTSNKAQIIVSQHEMPFALKQNDPGRGVEYIKEFNPSKAGFSKISTAEILNLYTWETEAHEILTAHPYFK